MRGLEEIKLQDFKLDKVEKLEKFARKVARISLLDVEIATGGIATTVIHDESIRFGVRRRVVGLIKEAKGLMGKGKIKKKRKESSP